MQLRELARARTGDKGNISQISVIAHEPGDYAFLAEHVTAERVQAHLAPTDPERVQRYELSGFGALNFVLDGALAGGVTRSLALDAHGKCLVRFCWNWRCRTFDDAGLTFAVAASGQPMATMSRTLSARIIRQLELPHLVRLQAVAARRAAPS
jgi:hypothetical protein